MLLSKQPLAPFEKEYLRRASQAEIEHFNGFYGGLPEAMKGLSFFDMSGMLNGRTAVDFYDYGHTNAFTSEIIGREIGRKLLMRPSVGEKQ